MKNIEQIEKYCLKNNLSTYDPYDIWKTKLGFFVKNLYNNNKFLGIIPAGIFTIFDIFINNKIRIFYKKQEQPVVRAFASLILLNLYINNNKNIYLKYIKIHLNWLINNSCKSIENFGWGIDFKHATAKNINYPKDTPLSTITPYVLEAFINYKKITNDSSFDFVIKGIYHFYEKDIKIIKETNNFIITSYAIFKDKTIINSVSYTMFAWATFYNYFPEIKDQINDKVDKLYTFIKSQQNDDGSWLYSSDGNSFIDCFHSCFILKNLIKVNQIIKLDGVEQIIDKGYNYIKNNFYNSNYKLFRRFSLSNKPSIVKFDLYDNTEMLNFAIMLKDNPLIKELSKSIKDNFIDKRGIFSVIDKFGVKRNKNTLRWAVMPYLFTISKLCNDRKKN